MPTRFGITPESLFQGLRRSDSKNPLTTCHGITSSGRPCRRALADAVNKLNAASNGFDDEESSVVAVLEENEIGSEITAFFCWQHKDQAEQYHVGRAKVMELKTRGSLEDMLSNMGLKDVDEVRSAMSTRSKPRQRKERRQSKGLQEPLMTVADEALDGPRLHGQNRTQDRLEPHDPRHEISPHNEQRRRREYARRDYERRPRKLHPQPSLWDMLCGCLSETDRDLQYNRPARQQRQPTHSNPSNAIATVPLGRPEMAQVKLSSAAHQRHDSKLSTPITTPDRVKHSTPARNTGASPNSNLLQVPAQRPPLRETHSQPTVIRKPVTQRPTDKTKRWISAEDPATAPHPSDNSKMGQAMSVIPGNASMKLASDLMAEMSKIQQDPREGYIYIYWLTASHASLADGAGGSLLYDSPRRGSHSPNAGPNIATPKSSDTVLLKIGRTDNVHRRLNQWQLQCGYKPLLVRSYPPPETGRKVMHVHRVERLIHLELGEKNVKWDCTHCGREHREWFEVKGREGVRDVDRIIEKWMDWGGRWDHGQ